MAVKPLSKLLEDQPPASSSEEEDFEEDSEEVREEGVNDEAEEVEEVEEEEEEVMEEEEEDDDEVEKLFMPIMLPSNMSMFRGSEGLKFIERSKAKELEQKWKKLKIAETKLFLERLNLIKEHVTMLLDVVKSSSS